MKNKISFLAMFACALCVNYANASECVGDDCEIKPVVIEQNFGPMDFVDINEYVEEETICEECNEFVEIESCYDYECPFDTPTECAVWYRKPEHKTYSGPRTSHLAAVRMDDILYAIYSNYDVNADDKNMSPLVERYKILTRASDACCGAGIIYKMRQKGASDADVYRFLMDDANYFAVIKRCMMMNNDEIMADYSYGVTGQMVADVRNACLCKNKKWFTNLLEPFNNVYERMPIFRSKPFVYSYVDDMHRDITVYINDDVQTTSGLLEECPK